MTQEHLDSDRHLAVQREVTRITLASVQGFALAGSGAIREHGVTDRPTEDVDLFTASQDIAEFSAAVEAMTAQLQASGFIVDQTRRAPQYARLHVATGDGLQLDVDLGVDWRRDDPVRLDVGYRGRRTRPRFRHCHVLPAARGRRPAATRAGCLLRRHRRPAGGYTGQIR